MKRKFLLPILSVCMVVALVSVGFAAWLITGNDTSDTATGNFVTYDVNNEFFKVTIDPTEATEKSGDTITTYGTDLVIFGKPTSAMTTTNATPWFKFDTTDHEQILEASFVVTIDADVDFATGTFEPSTVLDGNSIQVKLVGPADYDTAVGNGVVAYPTMKYNSETTTATVANGKTLATDGVVLTIPASAFAIDTTTNNATATVTITYAWGTKFGGTNPYVYFNNTYATANTEVSGTVGKNDASSLMEYVHALNNAEYTLALSVVANS